jgi:2'-5' RNA ligase
MRLFIALDLEELKDYFKEIQEQLPFGISKLKPVSSFHLTLKFLGDVEEDKLDELKQALSAVKFKPLKLKLAEALGVFPAESYIKVVWVGLEGNDELLKLQKDIEKALEPFHFRKDFEFMPHLTLARVKFIKDKPAFIEKLKAIKVEPKEITINKFKLIKSELTREGPVYTDLAKFS